MTTKPKPKRQSSTPIQPKPLKPDKPRLSRGRPLTYSKEKAEIICRRIANGESLRAICDDKDMPDRGTVLSWVKNVPEFSEPYAQARASQTDAFAEDLVYIADTDPDPARARIRVEARRWLAERTAPKKYGTRVELGGGGRDGAILVQFAAEDEKLM